MSIHDRSLPDQMPMLSRGKHRSPRKGACFMELASFLAGERWSDHPACTHPVLAAVARGVNDYTSDDARSRLALLIPSVIGLTTDDVHADARVALVCARTALPVAAAERQRVMAVGVLVCERLLNSLDGRPPGRLEKVSREALDRAPHAAQWAHRFARDELPTLKGFRRHGAPTIVSNAIKGIGEAGIAHADQLLHDLLVDAISAVTPYAHRTSRRSPVDAGGDSRIVEHSRARARRAPTRALWGARDAGV